MQFGKMGKGNITIYSVEKKLSPIVFPDGNIFKIKRVIFFKNPACIGSDGTFPSFKSVKMVSRLVRIIATKPYIAFLPKNGRIDRKSNGPLIPGKIIATTQDPISDIILSTILKRISESGEFRSFVVYGLFYPFRIGKSTVNTRILVALSLSGNSDFRKTLGMLYRVYSEFTAAIRKIADFALNGYGPSSSDD